MDFRSGSEGGPLLPGQIHIYIEAKGAAEFGAPFLDTERPVNKITSFLSRYCVLE